MDYRLVFCPEATISSFLDRLYTFRFLIVISIFSLFYRLSLFLSLTCVLYVELHVIQ